MQVPDAIGDGVKKGLARGKPTSGEQGYLNGAPGGPRGAADVAPRRDDGTKEGEGEG